MKLPAPAKPFRQGLVGLWFCRLSEKTLSTGWAMKPGISRAAGAISRYGSLHGGAEARRRRVARAVSPRLRLGP
ncbi:hypothetical protein BIV23_16415 [Streptomyces monashensis]|uniref:Uncharacterized protein n=1 Tax=Streptomyces monashensis TaxID=1678012 RepID=A0A1S2QEQ0_9ACTN|nr:hypothetical protein BIV23_16415 [Streptomyces monashensis]